MAMQWMDAITVGGFGVFPGIWRLSVSFPRRIFEVNYEAIDLFGTDASQFTRIMRAQRRVEESMRQRGGASVPEAPPH